MYLNYVPEVGHNSHVHAHTNTEESYQKTKAEGCQLSSQYVQAYGTTIKPTFSLGVRLLRGHLVFMIWVHHQGDLAVLLLHMPCIHCLTSLDNHLTVPLDTSSFLVTSIYNCGTHNVCCYTGVDMRLCAIWYKLQPFGGHCII